MGKTSSKMDAYGKVGRCKTDFKPEDLKGRVCYGGLDLSSTTDITAFILVFPPIEGMTTITYCLISGYQKKHATKSR